MSTFYLSVCTLDFFRVMCLFFHWYIYFRELFSEIHALTMFLRSSYCGVYGIVFGCLFVGLQGLSLEPHLFLGKSLATIPKLLCVFDLLFCVHGCFAWVFNFFTTCVHCPGTIITYGCELPCGDWTWFLWKSSQWVLLTSDPLLHAHT